MRILLTVVFGFIVPLVAAENGDDAPFAHVPIQAQHVIRGSFGNGGNPVVIAATGRTRVENENYDEGGEGVGYHDTDSINQGGAYRTDGVDLGGAVDVGGGFNVGYAEPGERLNYSLTVPIAGVYSLTLRIARGAPGAAVIRLFSNAGGPAENLAGDVSVPTSNGWQNWNDVLISGISLPAGSQVLQVEFVTGELNLNWMEFARVVPPPVAPAIPPAETSDSFATEVEQSNETGGGCGIGNSLSLILMAGCVGLHHMLRRR